MRERLIIAVRFALTIALLAWVWLSGASLAVTVSLTLVFLHAEASNALHRRHINDVTACAQTIRQVATETADAFIALLNRPRKDDADWINRHVGPRVH